MEIEKKKNWSVTNLTDDHRKLYYLLSRFSKAGNVEGEEEIWMKELAFFVFVHEGIIKGYFAQYDYSPLSVETPNSGRKFLNISQEMVDDIADLREIGLMENLKLSTTSYLIINAYRVMKHPDMVVSDEFKKEIDSIVTCPKCGTLLEVITNPDSNEDEEVFKVKCRNKKCDHSFYSSITKIEDVSYITSPYIPNIRHGDNLSHLKLEDQRS